MIFTYYTQIVEEKHYDLIQKYLFKFPLEYQHKILNYKQWQDAQLSLLGRLLLKQALNCHFKNFKGYTIDYSIYGKPFLMSKSIKFNISHSGNISICTITELEEIGIDIEQIKPINIYDFRQQMTSYEWKWISNSKNNLCSFYDYWTQKEAVLKAYGMGLHTRLSSFEIINSKAILQNELFSLHELTIDENYKCHLAVKGDLSPQNVAKAIKVEIE